MATWDYIVVGGGIAGLSIAEYLCKKNRVLVLEQYGNWGGRAATERFPATDDVPALQYEAGAGRIFHTHRRVHALIKRFGLRTYPITSESLYETHPNPFQAIFEPVRHLLAKLPKHDLATHTIRELVPMHHIFNTYPYWAEIQLMRADISVNSFTPDEPLGSRKNTDFCGIVEGVDSLTTNLYESAKAAGASLRNHHRVDTIEYKSDRRDLLEVKGTKQKQPFHYTARQVIVAVPFSQFARFAVLRNTPMMKQLAMSPLIRIYAVYPHVEGRVWFAGLKKTVTQNPLRYIIPINEEKGLIMISYTDGDDTNYWRNKDGEELEEAIQSNVRKLFPSLDIPKPVFFKKHDWIAGCTYWLPGDYDVSTASQMAHNPSPNVYVCGESVSQNQAWLEGALESVEMLKTIL